MTDVRAGSSGASGATADGPATERADARPMRADALRNHEKILRAAEEVFATDGVMVPIDVVAERAGVGVGTLYRHFPTKESLYEAIVTTRLTRLVATADAYAVDPEPGLALEHFMREFAQLAAEKQDLFEAFGQMGIDFKAHFAEPLAQLMARVDVLVKRAIETGTVRGDVETEDIIRLVVGTCHAAGHSDADAAGLQRLVSIVIAGLRPTERW